MIKENQQEGLLFSNPICKETYNSLPKIYGYSKKQRSPQKFKRPEVLNPTKHNCQPHQQIEKPKSPLNKRYSHAKSRYLSMPKAERCTKRNCMCNLTHEQQPKTLRKVNSTISPKKKIKLKPLLYVKPDDFQSEHKVAMKINTQPSMPTGLALMLNLQRNEKSGGLLHYKSNRPNTNAQADQTFINDIMEIQNDAEQTKRYNNVEQYALPRSLTEEIAIGTMDDLPQIQSQPYSFDSNLSRVTGLPSKEVACVEVQVDLLHDAIEKRSQKSEEQCGVGTQTNNVNTQNASSIRQKTDHSRYKKLSRVSKARKTKFYISQQESQQEDNEQSQIYNEEQQKRKNKHTKDLTMSRQSSSSLSLSSCLVRGLNSNKTQFKKLIEKQSNEQLKGSRVKSTKSNGSFRIPAQNEYASYLKSYRVLDKKSFNLKQLVKKPLFSILEEEEGVYFGEYDNERKNGEGINVTEKQIFEGLYENNVKVKGCERNIDGFYKGYFVNGKREGYGIFQWNNGQKFQGNWKDGVKCGFGIWRSPKGDSYEGQWMNNRQHGQGIFRHKNSTYKGEFENFLKHGRGQQIFINGDKYEGQYKFGKPDGYGKYIWHEGGEYEGQFKSGFRNGKGRLVETNGNIYTGYFQQDFKQGEGKQEYKSGQYFEGMFEKGKEFKGMLHKNEGKSEYIDNS